MPTLFRLLFVLAVLFGIVYGGMFALTVFVEPNTREMSVRVPQSRLNPVRLERPAVPPTAEDEDAAASDP